MAGECERWGGTEGDSGADAISEGEEDTTRLWVCGVGEEMLSLDRGRSDMCIFFASSA